MKKQNGSKERMPTIVRKPGDAPLHIRADSYDCRVLRRGSRAVVFLDLDRLIVSSRKSGARMDARVLRVSADGPRRVLMVIEREKV